MTAVKIPGRMGRESQVTSRCRALSRGNERLDEFVAVHNNTFMTAPRAALCLITKNLVRSLGATG
jgi:hypothetical protein